MRLLFLTNFYPPASRGGYELWCQEVAEILRQRHHQVMVLTSRYGQSALPQADPQWVFRKLNLEMELTSLRNGLEFFTRRKRREAENLGWLQEVVHSFAPNAILMWGMWNLPRSLPAMAEKLRPGRVAYYIADYWPRLPSQFTNYWQAPARNWATALPKLLLRQVAQRQLAREVQPRPQFEQAIFPTAFMRDELQRSGISPHTAKIIYGAIDTSAFYARNGSTPGQQDDYLRLLYIGRLTPEKGVHTAIEALDRLVRRQELKQVRLTLVGSGDAPYTGHLRQLVQRAGLETQVAFLEAQPWQAIPSLYQQADIFLFTSIWAEPFGRVLVEAMAAGVAVIGTATGGAAEILADGENSLLFAPGDATALAAQILRLANEPDLRRQLATAGQQTARTRFDIRRMTTEIEAYLQDLVSV